MSRSKPRTVRTITVRTTRNGKRRDFIADVAGKRQPDGTIRTANGIRWKV